MALVASPYGLRPISLIGGQSYAGALREIPLISNVASAFYYGCPVSWAAGVVTPLSATPTTTNGTTTPIGIFVGCEYTLASPVGYRLDGNYLPANAITNGYLNVTLKIVDDYDVLMQVQADGAVANTNRGKNVPLQTFTGSSTTGLSNITAISGSIATTNTLGLRIIDAVTWGEAYTDLIVKWNFGVHAYQQAQGL